MAKFISSKIRPARGYAHLFHLGFIVLLPLVVFVFVRVELASIALASIFLSKWRMFAVKPHYWSTNIRTNAVDVIVGLSLLTFLTNTSSIGWQLFWVLLYEIWLLLIRPGTGVLSVSLQALIAQVIGLVAIFLFLEDGLLAIYIALFWFISYFSARHFFISFDEPHGRILASQWGFFSACLIWVLGHWLLFFGPISVPALILSTLGFGLGGLYYLDETDRLSTLIKRQIIVMILALILIILFFSDWGDKAI